MSETTVVPDERPDEEAIAGERANVPAVVVDPAAQIAGDVPASWLAAMRLAARIHSTPFVPRPLRGDPHSVLACILTGDELGLGPMQSLRMVNVIEGRPAASAELMRALVNRAGHRIDVVEARQDRVTLAGRRHDTGAQATVTWTIADAQRARLMGNPAWEKYPRAMLLARATSELCRMLFADVIGGLYTPEETAAIEGHAYEPGLGELVDPVTDRALTGEVELDPDATAELAHQQAVTATDYRVSDGQIRKMIVLFNRLEITNRDDRIDSLRRIVGRPVGSSKELTVTEASKVIDALEAIADDEPTTDTPS